MYRTCAILLACIGATAGVGGFSLADDAAAPAILVTQRSAEDDAVYKALVTRRAWQFDQTPLGQVREAFQKSLGVNVALDARAIELIGLTLESPVALNLGDARAPTALDLICRELELAWHVRDGVLLITSPENAEQELETRVYDVAAICPPLDADGNEVPFDAEACIELITSTIAPASWMGTGGYGGMLEYTAGAARGLVIPQSPRTHEQIAFLLSDLARIKRVHELPAAGQQQPAADHSPSDDMTKVLAALDFKSDWKLDGQTLEEFLTSIEAATGIELVLDTNAADGIRSDQSTGLSGTLQATTARSALELVLLQQELTWTILDDVVLITSSENAEALFSVKVYDVHGIFPAVNSAGNPVEFDFDILIDLITSSVDASSWTDVGGSGAVQEFESGPLKVLVIAQSPQNHAAIAKLLADLRTLRARSPQPNAPVAPPIAEPGNPPAKIPTAPTSALSSGEVPNSANADAATGSGRFAVKLYRQLAAAEEGNVLVSPYSLFEALGMVYAGARGQTADELAKALECPGLEPEAAAAAFGRLRTDIAAHALLSKNELRIANRLWGQQDFPLLPEYVQTIGAQFDAAPELLDFGQREAAAQRINAWASEQTAGKIPAIVGADDFDELTRFVLTNAVYFKADWVKAFPASNTRRGEFASPKAKQPVQYMHLRTRCKYAQSEGVQLASIPYKGDRFSMVFLLPDVGRPYERLEASITPERLHDWLAALRLREVELKLPKFRFDATLELNPTLVALGVTSVFSPKQSDLSGISVAAKEQMLFVNQVRQKTFIEVNEQGTEAAAVTAIVSGAGGFAPKEREQVVKFHAERPFLFLIRDDETGVILFLGRVVRPEYPGHDDRRE